MLQKSLLGHSPLGFHRIAYTEWGETTTRPPLICVHGLTRNGRDFDRLAETLQKDQRVFCPDIAGRGKSGWLSDPGLYDYPQYISDMTALIARADAEAVDWVGTSMGGALGMFLAAAPNAPIRRLVLNDAGPFISKEASKVGLKRIAGYASPMPEFDDLGQAERYLRQIYAPFGIPDEEGWRQITAHSIRVLPDGKLTLSHDPAIGKKFAAFVAAMDKDVDFWSVYDRIQCPTLLLRGAQSDVLSSETAREMTRRGPKPKLIEFPNTGHAPALMDPAQIGIVGEFLRA